MRIEFFDNRPAKEGEKHGPLGPTHCGHVEVDYQYQVEMWVDEVKTWNSQGIVKVWCPDLRRQWERDTDTDDFKEVEFKEISPEPTSV